MSKTVNVLTLKNEAEAGLMESILETEGIPYMLKSYHDSAYDGLYQLQQGWGHIEAPEEYKERILELYRERNGRQEP
jgi:hypothetical protein